MIFNCKLHVKGLGWGDHISKFSGQESRLKFKEGELRMYFQ